MITYDEALQRVLNAVSPLPPVELALEEAAGLALAAPATARWDMPRCDNSAMDGFAIASNPKKNDAVFEIIGASYAGHPFNGEVQQGKAIRITTGAPLPEGVNSVIPVEETIENDDKISLFTTPETGQHVRYQGEEYKQGIVLAEPGTLLRAGEIALLASAGVERVQAFRKPRVAIISTGDELVELGQEPGPGQIINSNLHLLKIRLQESGCTPICIGIGKDDPGNLGKLIDQGLDADVIISTGGVSVGEKDHVQATLEQHDFKKIFWKVAIKPGKPVLFGMLQRTPYFGLPGNPAATAATFELLVKPALKCMAGHQQVLPQKRTAILTKKVAGGGKRQAFLWCHLEWRDNGYEVTVSDRQGSGQIRCLQASNAMLSMPIGAEALKAGAKVEILLIDDF
jgi:molybdopterin molybdotransferase